MSKTDCVLRVVVMVLAVNALLVMHTPLTLWERTGLNSPTRLLSNRVQLHLPCCTCNDSGRSWREKVNYSVVVTAVPSIDPSYRQTTLTRLGTDLRFDAQEMCPPESVMRKESWQKVVPLHDDCPNVFIVGARKAGTTSLYHYLSNHPHFEGTRLDFGPKSGETFHFSSLYNKENWTNYLKYFPSGGVMTGDASVGNLVHCMAPHRVFESCGKQSKIVILLRNPVNRFLSNFLMRAKLGIARVYNTTSLSVIVRSHLSAFYAEALKKNIDVTDMFQHWQQMLCLFDPATNLVYEGLYYVHVVNWLCNFPAENILIINSEEFYHNTTIIVNQVLQFLGLETLGDDTLRWITSTVYNKDSYRVPSYQTLSAEQRKELNHLYGSFNMALFNLLDWHSVDWS